MGINEIELEEQLKEAGNTLLNPPSSIDQLLDLLDKLECLLINVEQAPSRSMQDALLPPMKALVSTALLRHSETDVRVSVTSCISEITRITAPDAPYNDDQMKEIFQLIVSAIEKLSHVSSRCYSKGVSILDTVAKVRSCLVMLDLELDELVVKMFQIFLKIIRSNHPHTVFLAMETIMTLVIDESEDLSFDLLSPLLASVRKENQSVFPIAWKLGEKVMTNCSAKLKPYLKEAVQYAGIALDEYSPLIASICQEALPTFEHDHLNNSGKHWVNKELSPGEVFQAVDNIPNLKASIENPSIRNTDTAIDDNSEKLLEHRSITQHSKGTDGQNYAETKGKLDMETETLQRKRGRKPNSLMNPEEGYDHSWAFGGRKREKLHHGQKPQGKGIDNSPVRNAVLALPHVSIDTKRGRPKKKGSFINQHVSPNSLSDSRGEILSAKIKGRALQSDDASLKMLSQGRRNSGQKQQKRSRKIGLTTKTVKEKSLFPGSLLSVKEEAGLSKPEEKPSHQSIKLTVRCKGKDNSLGQSDSMKRGSAKGTSDEDFAEASVDKETKLSSKDGGYREETPKTKPKRKEVASETPDFGYRLLGIRIKVWWPRDKIFYEGVVDSYDPVKRKHKILYADGDEEVLNLRKQRWEIIQEDNLLDEVKGTDLTKCDASSDIIQKAERKEKSESSRQPKADSSLKRSGGATASKTKVGRSDTKFVDSAMHDTPILIGKPTNDSLESGSKADEKNSIYKLKIRSLKTAKKSKHTGSDAIIPNDNELPTCGDELHGSEADLKENPFNLLEEVYKVEN